MQANRIWINSSKKLENSFSIIEAVRKALLVMPIFMLSILLITCSHELVCYLGKALHKWYKSKGSPSRQSYLDQLLYFWTMLRVSPDPTFHSYPVLELLFFLVFFSWVAAISTPLTAALLPAAMCNRYNNLIWLHPEAFKCLCNTYPRTLNSATLQRESKPASL